MSTSIKCLAVMLCSMAFLTGCANSCTGYGCGYASYPSSCGAPSCTVNTTVVTETYSGYSYCDGVYDCW